MSTAVAEKALLETIQTQLQAATWPSSSDKVFADRVYITAGVDIKLAQLKRRPYALIRPGSLTMDPDLPGLYQEQITITIAADNYNDDTGQGVLLGTNNRASRGLLDAGRILSLTIQQLHRTTVPIIFRQASATVARQDADGKFFAFRDYFYTAHVAMES